MRDGLALLRDKPITALKIMSKTFLRSLAGRGRNGLHEWLDAHPSKPRIAWYPSAGEDYRDVLFLDAHYRQHHPARCHEPAPPDIYLHTDFLAGDYFDPFDFDRRVLLNDTPRTSITVMRRELLPETRIEFDPDLVGCAPSPKLGTVSFMLLLVKSHLLGTWTVPLIYAAVENTAMAGYMLAHRAKVSHIVQMRFGHGLGGGQIPPGFLTRLVDPLQTEAFITDRRFADGLDLQVPQFPSLNASPPVDLNSWVVARHRGSVPWHGYEPAKFFVRPKKELNGMTEKPYVCRQCRLGAILVQRHRVAANAGRQLPPSDEDIVVQHGHGHRITVRTIDGWTYQYLVNQSSVRVDRSSVGVEGRGRYQDFQQAHGDENHDFGRELQGNRTRSISGNTRHGAESDPAEYIRIADEALQIMTELYSIGSAVDAVRSPPSRPDMNPDGNNQHTQRAMTIRKASHPQDLQSITPLAERFNAFGDYTQVFAQMLAGEYIAGQPGVNVTNVEIIVAEVDGRGVVAFAAVEWMPVKGLVYGIAVREDHVRQHIASGLLRYIIQKAKHRKLTRLECITAETENPAAMGLFSRHGFQSLEFAGQYPKGQRAVRLSLKLEDAPEEANPAPVAGNGVAALVEPHTPRLQPIPSVAIKAYFQHSGRLQTLMGHKAWDAAQWPNVAGVYLIWRKVVERNDRQLLYIGKTGKYKRSGDDVVHFNSGTLRGRLQRWTPYCFQREGPHANHFEYGPNYGVNDLPNRPHADRYRHKVPAQEIEVECFLLNNWEQHLSPALLEAMLLQDHLRNHGDLPPANNEL